MAGQFTAADRRTKLILTTLVLVYLTTISVMAALGYYFFIFKSAILPILFLVALLSSRFTLFLRDWAIFLSLVILFDSIRGYIFALTTVFELPVYMGYAVTAERALLGGSLAPVLLQELWFADRAVGWLERLLVVVHASHFLFFLMLGLFVWFLRHELFWKYAVSMLAVMYLGLVGYLLIPTVPPWMAAAEYQVIEPVHKIGASVYNTVIPSLRIAFDTNPIAAMPSLHAAFPALCAMAALHAFGRRAAWTVAYALLVAVAVLYLGEHYLVDVLAGWALAVAVYLAVFRSRLLDWLASLPLPGGGRRDGVPAFALTLRTSLLVAAVFLASSEAIVYVGSGMHGALVPTAAFIERELAGKSPVEDQYRGERAFADRDYAAAQRYLMGVLPKLRDPYRAAGVAQLAGRSAFANEDDKTVLATLGRMSPDKLPEDDVFMLAVSAERLGNVEASMEIFQYLRQRAPEDPELLYWQTRLEYKHQLIASAQVEDVIARLRLYPDQRVGDALARELEGMLSAPH